jgi:glucose/arabinose dehydrogenase
MKYASVIVLSRLLWWVRLSMNSAFPITGMLLIFLISACQSDTPTSTPLASPTESETITLQPEVTTTPTLEEQTPPPIPTESTITEPVPTVGPPTIPDAEAYTWEPVIDGLNLPIGLAHAGDGSWRLFVLEQTGLIRIIHDGNLLPQPFLDISDRVSCCGERGLLGLAFPPNYSENGNFYVNYTDRNGDTVIARFSVSDNPDRALIESEERLLQVPQPYGNHNGGVVEFGPDGYLYLGLGDGGSAGDPQGYGQTLDTLLGKILRLDVHGGDPYDIPPDNPFASPGDDRGLLEIWAYGLRNPWRFSFDRLTGDLYIADVGQNAWEEINFLPAGSPGGANFGWNYFEGNHPHRGDPPPDLELVFPVAEYDHSLGCSVTGGVVYRGSALPAWDGVYLYGDYCSGNVWGLVRNTEGEWQEELLFETGVLITSFGEDEVGEVYLVDYDGMIYRLSEK